MNAYYEYEEIIEWKRKKNKIPLTNGWYNRGQFKRRYPYYYPAEVVDFFCRHHSREHILKGIASGNGGVLMGNDMIVGMGCYDGNHVTGVYVLPCCQNRGCGLLWISI